MAKTKILVVEDDEVLREMYAIKLRLEGFEVFTAMDGSEGLAKAEAESPDLILLDLLMPKITGLEFLAQYKNKHSIPVIIISNKSTPREINTAKNLGARDYLIKSQHTPDDIVKRIENELGLRK